MSFENIQSIFEYVSKFAALFAVLDFFVQREAKVKIAHHILGASLLDVSNFESTATSSILGIVSNKNNRPSIPKTLVYSVVFLVLFLLLGIDIPPSLDPNNLDLPKFDLKEEIIVISYLVALQFLLDYVSFVVSFKLFYKKLNPLRVFLVKVIVDILTSVFVALILVVISVLIANYYFGMLEIPRAKDVGYTGDLVFVLFVSLLSMTLLTFAQITCFAAGAFVYFMHSLTGFITSDRANISISAIEAAPFSVIGALTGLAFSVLKLIFGW